MANPKLPATTREAIIGVYNANRSLTRAEIAKQLKVSEGTVSNTLRQYANATPLNKKKSEFDWVEWSDLARQAQKLHKKASVSQKFATVEVGDGTEPITVLLFSDQHIGALGADYDAFFRITEEIKNTPNLYVILGGDALEMAIRLRSVSEVCAQILDPDKQERFLESWIAEIKHKLIASCWCNHGVERQEKMAGSSYIKRLLADACVYFNGIGHLDVKVGKQTYKFALSHKFRGHSYMNPCHAGMRYMRFQGSDREIALMGDIHQPAFMKYWDGPIERVSMVAGTLHTDSSYASRYFSLFTQAIFPVIELHHEEHRFTPFRNLEDCLGQRKRK